MNAHTKEEVLAMAHRIQYSQARHEEVGKACGMLRAYAALLGDGPVGYADPKSMQGYTLGAWPDFCVGDKSDIRSVPLYAAPSDGEEGKGNG